MAAEIKYQHPAEPSLIWSGKGRQPKWVDAFLASASGRSLAELEVGAKQSDSAVDEIDLGINEGSAAPTLGEKLYAGRIAAGQTPMPDNDSPSFTPGVHQALAESGTTQKKVSQANVGELVHAPAANLNVVAAKFGVTTEDLGELARIGADSINRAMFEIAKAGLAFLKAQELLSLGDFGREKTPVSEHSDTDGFSAWINANGLARQRVYEAMRIAKFVTQLPSEKLTDVLSLGKVKVMLLASLPQGVIDRAAESGTDLLEQADMMTVAELKEEIKALHRREKNYEAEIERAQSQVKRLSAARSRTTDFLLRTEEVREECLALQFGAELHLNSLKKLFEETDAEAPEGRLQLEQLWVTAHTVASRALDLVEFMQSRAPDDMPERVMGTHILSPAEAERWLLDYPTIENRYAAEQAKRQQKREAARPKGPGRPSGSGSKKGEA